MQFLSIDLGDWANVVLSIITAISIIVAIHYKRKDYQLANENRMRISGKLELFYSRESMLKYLHTMYDRAEASDTIWGQSISGRNYGSVGDKILNAAARGVHYKMIFNKNAHTINQVIDLFKTVDTAEVVELENNNVRLQGLSNKEVMIAISTERDYFGVLIKDENIVRLFHDWFEARFNSAPS